MPELVNGALQSVWQVWATIMVAAFVIGILIKAVKTQQERKNY